jgi:uncharacterized membrane protein YesL
MRERIFNSENKFFTFMGRLADLVILNIIFLLFSLPIFTIGASVTAMYYVTLRMVRDEDSYVFQTFWKSFKENFKQSTIIWLILLACGFILWVDFRAMSVIGTAGMGSVFYLALYLLLLIYGMVMAYTFPLQARFDNAIKNTLVNALKMAIAHLPYTILLLIITYVPMFLTLNYGIVMFFGFFVWLAVGFALTAYLTSKIYARIFARYIPEEEEEAAWVLED